MRFPILLTDQEDPRDDGPRAFGAFNGERISWNTACVDVMPVVSVDDAWDLRMRISRKLRAHIEASIYGGLDAFAAPVTIDFGFTFGEDAEP